MITLENKFKLGDVVRRYVTVPKVKESVVCPVCKGNYQAPNPNYGIDDDEDEYLFCGSCERGYISILEGEEKILKKPRYYVNSINVRIDSNGHSYRYGILSTPALNPGVPGYCASTEDEDNLVLSPSEEELKS